MPRPRSSLLAAVAAAAILALSGCSSSSGSGSSSTTAAAAPTTTAAPATTTTAPPAVAASDQLLAKGFAFTPTKLSFPAGGKISFTFKNGDSAEHNFTLEGGTKVSKDLTGGKTTTVSFTTPKAGTYKFHCEYHPALMKGTLTVT